MERFPSQIRCLFAFAFAFAFAIVLCACSAYDPSLLRPDASIDASMNRPDSADHDGGGDNDAGNNGCVPSTEELCLEICPETCNGRDDDCDARADEGGEELCDLLSARGVCVEGACLIGSCVDGASDCDGDPSTGCEARLDSPDHCGFCYAACNIPNAAARCEGTTCLFDRCLLGFGNCDGDEGNGCELRVDSLDNCGGCGVMCGAVENGQPGCIDLVCGVAECDTGFADCDGDVTNGCEASLDALGTCGRCDVSCAYDHAEPLCAGQSCVPGTCLAGFGDCDSEPQNECETRLDTDVNNCGVCGRACDSAGGGGSAYQCVDGQCVVTTCPSGFADCDRDANNGCETALNTLTDCGSCDVPCAFANGNASCTTGTCSFTTCQPGFGNCDNDVVDGCETALDTDSNCGACGTMCGVSDSRTCSGGICSLVSCPNGSADCDNNGLSCEQSLSTLAHCGACNARCGDTMGRLPNATAACGTGACAIGMCDANFANCDGSVGNGCETSLRTTASCGGCGTVCSRPNANVSCATGSCTVAACNTGFADCDGNTNNGCETSTDTINDCGACNNDCTRANAVMACTSGTCTRVACVSGFGDCDGNANNGCEQALNTLTHCGACNAACALSNGSESCTSGTCTLTGCSTAFGNCDFSAGNGCETPLNTNGNCNACGALCDYQNGSESCSTGSCTLTGCTSGFANCDTVDSNGCEQSLSTNNYCGSCTTACGVGSRCETGTCIQGFPYTTSNFDSTDPGIVPAAATTLNCGVSVFNSTPGAANNGFSNWCGQPMPTPFVRTQVGGPDVVVLAFDAFTISNGATLQLIGTRPVILASFGNATINGTIDASASGTTPGAGGNWSCGGSAGGNGAGSCSGGGGGGGGAGFATNGAQGGQSGTRGAAGTLRGNTATSPLFGGCNGGNGGGCSTTVGGAGGGAIQVSAAGTLTLGATGRVLATGANGLNGACGCSESGGGGGGSGGAVLLEGNAVVTTAGATITANGGRGGTGAGGPGGGNGGTGTSAPVNGSDSANGASGGGGSVGRGYIRGVASCTLAQTSSVSLGVAGACPPTAPSGSNCRYFTNAGHHYFFCDETNRNWSGARSQCQSIGFDLVRVNDSAENEFLRTRLTVAQPYILGAFDNVTEGQWRWAIGNTHFWQGVANGTAQAGLYENWNTGEPNAANGSEDFAYIDGTGFWNDDDNPTHPFICESL